MSESVGKTLISGLLCCVVAVCAAIADSPSSHEVQPLALDRAGIGALRLADPNLTGDGVNLAMVCRSMTYEDGAPLNDYRPDFSHDCLVNTGITFFDSGNPAAGLSDHATAIASILFGRDPNGASPALGRFDYRGVVPDAKAQAYQFDQFVIDNIVPQRAPLADVVSISFGDAFERWWTRGIESLAQHSGVVFVAAIGNGSDAYDPPLYPAAGANAIAVGVVDSVDVADLATRLANFALASPDHSTYGPAGSGRCKPDIVAPGNCLVAVAGEPNVYSASGDYSSFATPVVSGIAGLLIQKLQSEPRLAAAGTGDAMNCLIKAILLNSATKLPFWHKGLLSEDDDHVSPLDYIQGAGMVDAHAAYEQLIAGPGKGGSAASVGWDKGTLSTKGESRQAYRFRVSEPAGKHITVTAVWNNHYRQTFPFEAVTDKDADLKLELWAVDSEDENADYLLDYCDSRVDNIEHIHRPADANYTEYEIVISMNEAGEEDAPRGRHHYAIAWNAGNLGKQDDILWYDLDSDGVVGRSDLIMLVENLKLAYKGSKGYLLGDLNSNGAIDIDDVQIMMDRIGLTAEWHLQDEDITENSPRITDSGGLPVETSL